MWKTYLKRKHISWIVFVALFGVSILLMGLASLEHQQEELANKMLRLHVLANSDTQEDQALKLVVRDAVIEHIEPLLEDEQDVDSVQRMLGENTLEIAQTAEKIVKEQGYAYPVKVALEHTWFPTKQYDGFSLPAGQYDSLRVVIGEGEGHNWWCVLFPPLCVSTSTKSMKETASEMGLTDQEVFLITEESEQYEIRFKAIEWWETLKHDWT